MCVICHSAPGIEQSEISKGQNPEPPDLGEEVLKSSREELFWIVKNGLKMTGMPAFGLSPSDREIGDIVGFITRLPDIALKNTRDSVRRWVGKIPWDTVIKKSGSGTQGKAEKLVRRSGMEEFPPPSPR
jgi:hypothetical protein